MVRPTHKEEVPDAANIPGKQAGERQGNLHVLGLVLSTEAQGSMCSVCWQGAEHVTVECVFSGMYCSDCT